MPKFGFENLKIRAGPPPIRVEQGWLAIYHAVIGHIPDGFEPTTQKVEYAAGAMMLDADNPSRVIARSDTSILAPTPRTSATASSRTLSSRPPSNRSTAFATCSTA
jgi:beta-1,2-mannobiose phosphorylase / 1,2-beta-oligomannan phosphorylase